jgi:alpha-glucosidase
VRAAVASGRGRTSKDAAEWWCDAVFYQIYPRSFQDSDGDGVGDLEGVRRRLPYLSDLGVDAFWLSPIYPSPLADGGYDITDHADVHPLFGSLDDFDRLLAEAHARRLRVILDLVPSHTSIEHPWFREHPDWYVWSDIGPANNWLSAFGGSAWSRDDATGRWYLHSFYPEQPDLNWRHPEVRRAVGDVIRFWRARGVDGFRVDAVDRLAKDPELRDDPPALEPWSLPLPAEYAALHHVHSRSATGIGDALASIREAAGDAFLVGEVFRPTAELALYLEHFDAVFAFEFMFAAWEPEALARVLAPVCELGRVAWVLANHDFPRLASRHGEESTRLAAMLQLTLPGPAFVYQGDELGMVDGRPGSRFDRAGRDAARHPMQWDASPSAGFTEGTPWLPPIDQERRNVADQRDDPDSLLMLYRSLVRLRPQLRGALEILAAEDGRLAYRRGDHVVELNLSDDVIPRLSEGEVVLATHRGYEDRLAPRGGVVLVGPGSRA